MMLTIGGHLTAEAVSGNMGLAAAFCKQVLRPYTKTLENTRALARWVCHLQTSEVTVSTPLSVIRCYNGYRLSFNQRSDWSGIVSYLVKFGQSHSGAVHSSQWAAKMAKSPQETSPP